MLMFLKPLLVHLESSVLPLLIFRFLFSHAYGYIDNS